MKKRPIIIALVVVIILSLGVIAYGILNSSTRQESGQLNNSSRQEAIDEARRFTPPEGMMCTQVLTPAIHKETGATHTFPTGCLPDGWERDDSATFPRDTEDADADDEDDDAASPGAAQSDATSSRSSSQVNSATSDRVSRNQAASAPSVGSGIDPREAALNEAKSFRPSPDQRCTQVLTPAIHKETGARYTFPTGCLPAGWFPERNAQPFTPA